MRIIVGMGGGIAAYKAAMLLRLFAKNGDEVILDNFPVRQGEVWTDERSAHDDEYFSVEDHNSAIVLPKGSIYKLTGKYLTWEDDPISLKSVIETDSS